MIKTKALKTIASAILAFTLFGASASAYTYNLVDAADMLIPSDWAENETDKAKNYELIDENENIFYHSYIDREQFAELIVTCVEKLVDTDKIKTNNITFTDTDNEQILKAASMGIVAGVGDNKFAPDNKITRQEIAAMMYRAIKYVEGAKSKSYLKSGTSLDGYTDSGSVSEWARESVGSLVNNKIIYGTSDTELSPLLNTTVEQAILLDVRIYELMK